MAEVEATLQQQNPSRETPHLKFVGLFVGVTLTFPVIRQFFAGSNPAPRTIPPLDDFSTRSDHGPRLSDFFHGVSFRFLWLMDISRSEPIGSGTKSRLWKRPICLSAQPASMKHDQTVSIEITAASRQTISNRSFMITAGAKLESAKALAPERQFCGRGGPFPAERFPLHRYLRRPGIKKGNGNFRFWHCATIHACQLRHD